MSDTVQKIKERLSIVDVVGPYVKLTRAGKYWKGLSPFTKEKTPSFFVTPDRGLYHCFSTGKGGDMFSFIEEMESVDFKGALKILADKAGVEIVHEAPGVKSERDQVYAALEAAVEYFRTTLTTRPDVREYLFKRGIDDALVHHWRIGYAPKDWSLLKDALIKKGFSEHILELAGLIKKADSTDGAGKGARTYDRFRGRIMFPLFDPSGRPIAFSGRIFEDDVAHPQAKYLNSPEGPLFDKSRALYGIQDAKNGIRELGCAMLVEGQVDLLLSHAVGFRNAVATSGTAFTLSHAEILKRYSQNILLAYDGDQAGINATHRAALILLPLGMNVKVVALPAGVDPADLIGKDADAFKSRVKSAEPVVDFFVSHLKRTLTDERKQKLEVGKVVLPLVAAIDNALDQAHFVTRIAESLGVDAAAVTTELKKIKATGGVSALGSSEDPIFSTGQNEGLLYGILRTYEDAADARAARVEGFLVSSFGSERMAHLRALTLDEEEKLRILASENFFVLHPDDAAQNAFLDELERESRARNQKGKEAYAELKHSLVEAEKAHNTEAVERIMRELNELSKNI